MRLLLVRVGRSRRRSARGRAPFSPMASGPGRSVGAGRPSNFRRREAQARTSDAVRHDQMQHGHMRPYSTDRQAVAKPAGHSALISTAPFDSGPCALARRLPVTEPSSAPQIVGLSAHDLPCLAAFGGSVGDTSVSVCFDRIKPLVDETVRRLAVKSFRNDTTSTKSHIHALTETTRFAGLS